MKKIAILLNILAVIVLTGCSQSNLTKTGFISDYSKLQKETDSSLRYVNEVAIKRYSAFIVDPVQARLGTAKSELNPQQLTDLQNYMHTKIVQAVRVSGKRVVHQPGPGVARVRVALTDLEKTGAINMLPQASLVGAGVGGASMEAEIVDSVSGTQLGAVIESKEGSRMPFSNLGDWTAAKGVMDSWAQRFQKRLSE